MLAALAGAAALAAALTCGAPPAGAGICREHPPRGGRSAGPDLRVLHRTVPARRGGLALCLRGASGPRTRPGSRPFRPSPQRQFWTPSLYLGALTLMLALARIRVQAPGRSPLANLALAGRGGRPRGQLRPVRWTALAGALAPRGRGRPGSARPRHRSRSDRRVSRRRGGECLRPARRRPPRLHAVSLSRQAADIRRGGAGGAGGTWLGPAGRRRDPSAAARGFGRPCHDPGGADPGARRARAARRLVEPAAPCRRRVRPGRSPAPRWRRRSAA